ncbi:MAG: glutathione-disulfide reductase [unclassified Hahellaceae]|nr:glutathione-disulfide reductase [Hahellaceae bacterium]|tara:strand:+ start:48015 stop:49388 length:1374 start_codon:yes stop_codon:yes gene_type:complete
MYDLLVIGAGSGGVRAARMAAAFGARVAIAEDRFYGGTCVNVGCVPKKLFMYASHYGEDFADAAGYGWSVGQVDFDWPTLVANKDAEINRLKGIYRNMLVQAGVDVIDGRARFESNNEVSIEGQRYQAKNFLIASGSRSFLPHFPGSEFVSLSDDLFSLPALPKRAVVVGGGYIAVEFAGILNGLGVEVTLLHRGPQLLRRFDIDIRQELHRELAEKGIRLLLERQVHEISEVSDAEQAQGRLKLDLGHDEAEFTDHVFYATGRVPNSDALGLENTEVETGARGEVLVDERYRTAAAGIYAVGDVIDRVQLTPVALAEGMFVARSLFGGEDNPPRAIDYTQIASAVFSQPSAASIGPSEEEARMKYADISIFRSSFRRLKNTLSGNPERTLMKLIVEKATDKVIAAHMVGPDAGEIIQGLAVAIKAGATKAHFDSTIGIHPTSAEEFVTMRTPVEPT